MWLVSEVFVVGRRALRPPEGTRPAAEVGLPPVLSSDLRSCLVPWNC